MSDTVEELWKAHFPDDKLPGSPEPEPDKCGSHLKDKRLKELGIVRYCVKTRGMGTPHLGEGRCKWHGGSTPSHLKAAAKVAVRREVLTLAQQLGEELEPMMAPEIELWRLSQKMRAWGLAIEDKVAALETLVVEDQAGVEHAKALVEMLERAWERSQATYQFMLKYDLKRRVIALEEEQARLIGKIIFDVLLDPKMKLSEAQIELARASLSTKFTDLGAELVPSWAEGIIDDEEIIDAEIVE